MTPPLCYGCKELPVKRKTGGRSNFKLGKRIIDGIHWRWFCSRECAGVYCQSLQPMESRRRNWEKLVAFNREKQRESCAGDIREVCGDALKGWPPEKVRVVIGLLVKMRTVGYKQGWATRNVRALRDGGYKFRKKAAA